MQNYSKNLQKKEKIIVQRFGTLVIGAEHRTTIQIHTNIFKQSKDMKPYFAKTQKQVSKADLHGTSPLRKALSVRFRELPTQKQKNGAKRTYKAYKAAARQANKKLCVF